MRWSMLVLVLALPGLALAEDAAVEEKTPVQLAEEGLATLREQPSVLRELAGDSDDLDAVKPMSSKDAAIVGATTTAVGAPLWKGAMMLHDASPKLAPVVEAVAPVALPIATTIGSRHVSKALGVKEKARRGSLAGTAAQVAWSRAWAKRDWSDAATKAALLSTPVVGASAEVAVSHLPHEAQEKLENKANPEPEGPSLASTAAEAAARFVIGVVVSVGR